MLNIENNTQNVINKTIKETREIFGGNKKASLSSILMDYYEALNARTKQHVFSGLAAGLLDVIRQRYMDDNKIIYALIKALFGLRLDDFNDSYTDRIISTIIEAKDFVDRFNNATHEAIYNSNDGYKIIFINSNGNEEAKHISASELPTQARSFANEIETLFDEYGESLSTPQKAQVFLEVLKKIFK